MHKAVLRIPEILRQLESLYGAQAPCWPTDLYHFLVWWHCGYPASDAACAKGWESLNGEVGVEPRQLLAAGATRLARALKPGGMVPELRAMRLMAIAARIQDEYGGDLRASLAGPLTKVRQALKRFPNIADPGADRILLFGGIAPVPAVPSNCMQTQQSKMRSVSRQLFLCFLRPQTPWTVHTRMIAVRSIPAPPKYLPASRRSGSPRNVSRLDAASAGSLQPPEPVSASNGSLGT